MITIPIEFARLIWRMLLANSSVREAAKTARVCLIRHAPLAASLYSLFIQNHCAKSGTFGFQNQFGKSGDSPIAKQWA